MAIAVVFTSVNAIASEYEKRNLSLAGFFSPGHEEDPLYKSCVHLGDLVKKYTDGKVTVTITGEGQIYSSGSEMLKAAMMGALDIVWVPQSRHTVVGARRVGEFLPYLDY